MIQSQQKTSLLVPQQLPKFISEDPAYENFVLFLQAYYEWMEENGNVLDFCNEYTEQIDKTCLDKYKEVHKNNK